MEESKRERVGGGKEVLSPSLPNPTLSPFFLAHFSLRFPNYLKACYRLTTCIPSFPTFYGIYSTNRQCLPPVQGPSSTKIPCSRPLLGIV